MIIKSIDLKNFRNYDLQNIEFDPFTNIIYGDNAQGKTNILEAVFVAATTKSHRGSKDGEMISLDKEESHIKVMVNKKGIDYRVDMHLKKNKAKGIAVNGVPIKRTVDLFGIMNVIFFSPEDLKIIKSSPSVRRKFIDMELCQLDKIYANNLVNYNKALDQRNRLLKEISFKPELRDTLDIWDIQLVNYGKSLILRRQKFIHELNDIINSIHFNLSGGTERLIVEYAPSENVENFEQNILNSHERDIKMKMTMSGPHRDDMNFIIGGMDMKTYGSQGQQRTIALSLKLSEIEIVKKSIGDSPILLLDDVLSELDSKRQNYLLNSIKDVQTIITCTGLDEFINNRFGINRIYKVVKGHVFKEN